MYTASLFRSTYLSFEEVQKMSNPETLRPVTEEELLEASETIINIENANIGIIDHDGLFHHVLLATGGGKCIYSRQGESVINPDEYDYEEVDE